MTAGSPSIEIDDDLRHQGEGLGIDVDALAAEIEMDSPEAEAEAVTEVWACNWGALLVFLGCQTQWRVVPTITIGPMGGALPHLIHQGLDYTAVEVVMRRLGHDDDATFASVQIMEAAARPILNGAAG